MTSLDLIGTNIRLGEELTLPEADNDNKRLMEDWMTPAELMQWIQRTQEEMRQERAADASLLTCPKHRRQWDSLQAIERCARWHYFREPE
jgi:hypothetical protein